MRRISVSLVLCFALAAPTIALGAHGHHGHHGRHHHGCPSGNSGVDQYVECVPGAGGHHPSSDQGGGGATGGGNGGGSSSGLSNSESQALANRGPAGLAAANLAAATAPRVSSNGNGAGANSGAGRGSGGSGARGKAPSSTATTSGDSGLGAILDDLTGSAAGMGAGLPILLLATAVGAVGFLLGRRLKSGPAHRA